jgi:hypothetical protein
MQAVPATRGSFRWPVGDRDDVRSVGFGIAGSRASSWRGREPLARDTVRAARYLIGAVMAPVSDTSGRSMSGLVQIGENLAVSAIWPRECTLSMCPCRPWLFTISVGQWGCGMGQPARVVFLGQWSAEGAASCRYATRPQGGRATPCFPMFSDI